MTLDVHTSSIVCYACASTHILTGSAAESSWSSASPGTSPNATQASGFPQLLSGSAALASRRSM
eukprot:5298920-Amphidinium_carterae.2